MNKLGIIGLIFLFCEAIYSFISFIKEYRDLERKHINSKLYFLKFYIPYININYNCKFLFYKLKKLEINIDINEKQQIIEKLNNKNYKSIKFLQNYLTRELTNVKFKVNINYI